MTQRKNDLLDVLSEVKTRVQDKLGIVDFPMPQFIIVGSQSVGKSRLIETLAGEQFNFISGTLGSRRPTILEFRNVEAAEESVWSVLDERTNKWLTKPTPEVMKIVGEAHNSLGMSVSAVPVHVRIESKLCVDLQIVDLPGYRSYAADDNGRILAQKIEELNGAFLFDQRNVILCVEEAGDAANLSSLRRVSEADPQYKRTILIRSKLDKYYGDLEPKTVNKWLDGMGDLPKNLQKFALTLPHWSDGAPPPAPLSELRDETSKTDSNKLAALGATRTHMDKVGFNNFARHMERRTELMFAEAMGPVLTKLRDLESAMSLREEELGDELEQSEPARMLATIRACGMSFANCLSHVMEGVIRSDVNRVSLDVELRDFHRYHQTLGGSRMFEPCPHEMFQNVEEYIKRLRNDIRVPMFDVEVNGGAQFKRLMYEVETYLRFSEMGTEIKSANVLQAFGISMGSVTWADVVVKLLNHDCHMPMQHHVAYVGERVKWFFMKQKEPIVHFMKSLRGSPDEKIYSVLYTKHAALIEENPTIKKMVFETFDAVVDRQLQYFLTLFRNTLQATFSNPWVFLKKNTAKWNDEDEVVLSSLEETINRIPKEVGSRSALERSVAKLLSDIPMEPHKLDEAVDRIQVLALKVYAHIRSRICDQVELFCESFFKLPLLRRLEEDMNKMELSEVDMQGHRARRAKLEKEKKAISYGLKEVQDCLRILTNFQVKSMAQKV